MNEAIVAVNDSFTGMLQIEKPDYKTLKTTIIQNKKYPLKVVCGHVFMGVNKGGLIL